MEPYRLFDNQTNDGFDGNNDAFFDEMNCFDVDDEKENYESEHNVAEALAHFSTYSTTSSSNADGNVSEALNNVSMTVGEEQNCQIEQV